MARERDLFRAIVLSAVALVSSAPGCGDGDEVVDSGTRDAGSGEDASSGEDAGTMLADASSVDASEPIDASTIDEDDAGDAMVLIL